MTRIVTNTTIREITTRERTQKNVTLDVRDTISLDTKQVKIFVRSEAELLQILASNIDWNFHIPGAR